MTRSLSIFIYANIPLSEYQSIVVLVYSDLLEVLDMDKSDISKMVE